jgi:two-component system, LuxR family, response regulator FixJ
MPIMPNEQGTVFIVDDDAAVRDGLSLLMKSVALPARFFASADEFLREWQPDLYGCLLLDVRMPGMGGLELQKELIRRRITLPVIFMTGHGDVQMAVEALQLGAFDFLEKPFRDEELLQRINRALAQDREDRARDREQTAVRARLQALTPREREIARRLIDGQANKRIALDLDISQRTVELHRAHIMEKMQARSLAQLVRQFVQAGEA